MPATLRSRTLWIWCSSSTWVASTSGTDAPVRSLGSHRRASTSSGSGPGTLRCVSVRMSFLLFLGVARRGEGLGHPLTPSWVPLLLLSRQEWFWRVRSSCWCSSWWATWSGWLLQVARWRTWCVGVPSSLWFPSHSEASGAGTLSRRAVVRPPALYQRTMPAVLVGEKMEVMAGRGEGGEGEVGWGGGAERRAGKGW